MIRTSFSIVILLFFIVGSCTTQVEPSLPDDTIFINYEKQASPLIGYEEYSNLLKETIDYSRIPKNAKGKVYVQFIVDTDGFAKNHKVIKSDCNSCEVEALRVFGSLNAKWNPYEYKGKPKTVYQILPITF